MSEPAAWVPSSVSEGPHPLESDEVHVWRVAFDVADAHLAGYHLRLSEAERQRADRYRLPQPRRQYTVMRAALRSILGRYLNVPPAAIDFSSGPEGKPEVSTPRDRRIEFSVSHSHGLGLCAVARRRVGVDVECLERRPVDLEEIVRRFFSAAECAAFLELPATERREAFYNGWTRKEAFIKAIGRGLFAALDSFDVSLKPGEPPRIHAVRGGSEDAADWSLFSLKPGANYIGALAVEGRAIRLSFWSWVGPIG